MPDGFDPAAPAAPAPSSTPAASPAPSTPAAAPAPSATPSPSTPSATPAAAGTTQTPLQTGNATTTTPTGDAGVPPELRQLAGILGDPADLKSALDFLRTFKADVERARASQRANDPTVQAAERRGATFRSLMEEGYSREHAEALMRLPELLEERDAQRVEYAKQDLQHLLSSELGLTFPDTDEGREALQEWEDSVADILNRDAKLNRLYFNPATRREAITQAIALEERRINRVLLAQNAATLRDAAKRRTAPSAARGATPTVTVREEMPKAPYSDAAGRRREHRDIASRQMNDILAQFGL